MSNRKEKAAQFAEEGYLIQVTGRNVMVTEAMKNHAMEKIAKIERFTTRILDVQITMDIQRVDHRVDIIMKAGHLMIKSHAIDVDMYAAIDKAVHKLETQLKRYKSKLQNHTARPLEAVDMRVNVYRAPQQIELDEVNDAIADETARKLAEEFNHHEIVSEETMPLKVLTTEEAMIKMDLSGNRFLLFRDEADRKLKLIYRRTDGNYGIMHPEG